MNEGKYQEFDGDIPPPKVDDELWVTKDGRRLMVADMDEDHAKNALRMVLRGLRQAREKAVLQRQLNMLRKLADEDWNNDRRWGSGS